MYNKNKRIIIISMVLLVLVIVAITFSFSADEEPVVITDEVMSLYNELNETSYKLLNSDKYLVTDNYISRILPNTKIDELKEGFNIDKDNIKIFDGEEEVTTGIIETGMILKENNNTYTLVVIGDISKDGKLDKVDLTKIINNTKTTELDELTKKSSDINEDNIVDKTDVELAIKNIFDEGLEVKTIEAVSEPTIDVIEGEETDGWYKENVKLKVSNTSEDVVKTVYLIKGTKERLETIVSDTEIEVSGYGAYKVIAYSYGKDGNRSNPVELVVGVDTDNKCIKYGVETLSECMLLNDGDYKSVEAAIAGIKTKTADFSQISTTDEGLLMALDDQGESFYYRGALEDNFVEFAGFTWRIIRRNSDGSVRMIYNGISTDKLGKTKGIGVFQYNENLNDFAYVGYMYGINQVFKSTTKKNINYFDEEIDYYYSDNYECDDETKKCKLTGNFIVGKWKEKYTEVLGGNETNGNVPYKYTCWDTSIESQCQNVSEVVSTAKNGDSIYNTRAYVFYHGYINENYEKLSSNEVNSNAKIVLENWYEEKILNTQDLYGKRNSLYIESQVFCNDRSINKGDSETLDIQTEYNGYMRSKNAEPTLNCSRKEDSFDVDGEKGNGMLKYPIGLITADEAIMAGVTFDKNNEENWLNIDHAYWTMTPAMLRTSTISANNHFITAYGDISTYLVNTKYYLRPVINLSSDVLVTDGDGTANSPYKVSLSK